jgi:hypothetical protein
MTGELCDCYASKSEGVTHILDAVEQVAEEWRILVWRTDGTLVDLRTAQRESPLLVASANWLALATWAGRLAPRGPAILIDVGSTTTDIIPIRDGVPIPAGHSDPERLQSGELVYTGVRRTPLCAVLGFEVAAEFFATTHDAYLVLGWASEERADTDTADGRPATIECAHARLARMTCADLDTTTEDERIQTARRVLVRQSTYLADRIRGVVERMGQKPQAVIVVGAGERLAMRAVRVALAESVFDSISLSKTLGPQVSASACAYALAVLASERA